MDDLESTQFMELYEYNYREHQVSHGPPRPQPVDLPAQPQPVDLPAVEKFDDER